MTYFVFSDTFIEVSLSPRWPPVFYYFHIPSYQPPPSSSPPASTTSAQPVSPAPPSLRLVQSSAVTWRCPIVQHLHPDCIFLDLWKSSTRRGIANRGICPMISPSSSLPPPSLVASPCSVRSAEASLSLSAPPARPAPAPLSASPCSIKHQSWQHTRVSQ